MESKDVSSCLHYRKRKNGFLLTKKGKFQRWICTDCGENITGECIVKFER